MKGKTSSNKIIIMCGQSVTLNPFCMGCCSLLPRHNHWDLLVVGALLKPARQNENVLRSQTADIVTEERNHVPRIPTHSRHPKNQIYLNRGEHFFGSSKRWPRKLASKSNISSLSSIERKHNTLCLSTDKKRADGGKGESNDVFPFLVSF